MSETLVIVSAVMQAVAAAVLVCITWRYVNLTRYLIDIQVEPRLDLYIPPDVFTGADARLRLVNNATCDVDAITVMVSVPEISDIKGGYTIMRNTGVEELSTRLKPGRSVSFDARKYFENATASRASSRFPDPKSAFQVSVQYRRVVDGKTFCYREPYQVTIDDDNNYRLCKSGPRQTVDSLEAYIVRPIKRMHESELGG